MASNIDSQPTTPEVRKKGRPGRGQPPAIDQLPKDMRDKCIEIMLSGRKGCDSEVARLAGVSRQAINEYRRRHLGKAIGIAKQLESLQFGNTNAPQDITSQLARTAQITKDVAGALPILAVRENRLKAKQERHDRLRLVMDERAEDMATVPGGRSGLLVRQIKQIGNGESAREVEEYKLDTGLLSEFREHEKEIAMELGQWNDGRPAAVDLNLALIVQIPRSSPCEAVDVQFSELPASTEG